MKELRFSICLGQGQKPKEIIETLKPFNKNRPANAQVQLHMVPWENYKQELTAIALYSQEMDISQVGAPLVNDLIAMKAIRWFSDREVAALGGAPAFSQVAWENSHRISDGRVWAIPWIVDPRAIFYWKDMLEKAGVDESTAFTSFEQMEETFRRLQASGVETPFVLGLDSKTNAFQTACSWIWGAGGEIGDENRVLFTRPKAIQGLRNFFSLYRYMPQVGQPLDFNSTFNEYFLKKRAAVTIANLGPFFNIQRDLSPDEREQFGVTLAPAPLFVGSSSLVIWQNSQNEADAINLIQHLTGDAAQREYCTSGGFMPARLSVLNEAPFSTDPHLRVFARSALNGRTLANIKLGGLLEDLLANAIGRIWAKIFTNPEVDLDDAIPEELEQVGHRISPMA